MTLGTSCQQLIFVGGYDLRIWQSLKAGLKAAAYLTPTSTQVLPLSASSTISEEHIRLHIVTEYTAWSASFERPANTSRFFSRRVQGALSLAHVASKLLGAESSVLRVSQQLASTADALPAPELATIVSNITFEYLDAF